MARKVIILAVCACGLLAIANPEKAMADAAKPKRKKTPPPDEG